MSSGLPHSICSPSFSSSYLHCLIKSAYTKAVPPTPGERHWATNTFLSGRKVRVTGPEVINSNIPFHLRGKIKKNRKGIFILNPASWKLELSFSLKCNYVFLIFFPLQNHLVAKHTCVCQVSEEIKAIRLDTTVFRDFCLQFILSGTTKDI